MYSALVVDMPAQSGSGVCMSKSCHEKRSRVVPITQEQVITRPPTFPNVPHRRARSLGYKPTLTKKSNGINFKYLTSVLRALSSEKHRALLRILVNSSTKRPHKEWHKLYSKVCANFIQHFALKANQLPVVKTTMVLPFYNFVLAFCEEYAVEGENNFELEELSNDSRDDGLVYADDPTLTLRQNLYVKLMSVFKEWNYHLVEPEELPAFLRSYNMNASDPDDIPIVDPRLVRGHRSIDAPMNVIYADVADHFFRHLNQSKTTIQTLISIMDPNFTKDLYTRKEVMDYLSNHLPTDLVVELIYKAHSLPMPLAKVSKKAATI